MNILSQHSNLQNQSRIAILKAREELIQKLKDQAREQLSVISKNEAAYSKLLTNLIAQALYRLVEKEVHIKCREKDLSLVQQSVNEAIALYKNAIHRDVVIKILPTYLNPEMYIIYFKLIFVPFYIYLFVSSGGIEAYTTDHKIKVINTLEARLNMLFDQMIPEIREKLFGKNKNRVHNN